MKTSSLSVKFYSFVIFGIHYSVCTVTVTTVRVRENRRLVGWYFQNWIKRGKVSGPEAVPFYSFLRRVNKSTVRYIPSWLRGSTEN